MKKRLFYFLLFILVFNFTQAQPWNDKTHLTHQDTLRGSVTPERKWWDVLYYAITIKPDFLSKTIIGSNNIKYKVLNGSSNIYMQIDLQKPLKIDSVLSNNKSKISFYNNGNVWYLKLLNQQKESINCITI